MSSSNTHSFSLGTRPNGAPTGSAFAQLDDVCSTRGVYGKVVVATDPAGHASLAKHLARRAAQLGRPVVTCIGAPVADPWQQLARKLDVLEPNDDTREVARRFAERARGSVVIVGEQRSTAWGRALDAELSVVCRASGATRRASGATWAHDPEIGMLLVVLRPAPAMGSSTLCRASGATKSSTLSGASGATTPDDSTLSGASGATICEGVDVDLQLTVDELSSADTKRWWSAIVAHDPVVGESPLQSLARLDAWWERARGTTEPSASSLPIDGSLGMLLSYAVAAQQALSPQQAASLVSVVGSSPDGSSHVSGSSPDGSSRVVGSSPDGSSLSVSGSAISVLVERGLVVADAASGAISVVDARHATPLDRSAKRRLAAALVAGERDAWSLLRAAELVWEAGEMDEAEQLAFAALRHAPDASARLDLWRRWEQLVDGDPSADVPGDTRTPFDGLGPEGPEQRSVALGAGGPARRDDESRLCRWIRTAEHALDLGDWERADVLARRALAIDGDRFDVALLYGRSSQARGDVTTAALSLSRALALAADDPSRARAAGLMAHVRLVAGDPKQAKRYAIMAIEQAGDVVTRLDGRNVLGKLLLAREAWAEAEQHFAADAYEASLAGQIEAELRARLNRAISILYIGRRDKAREMLEGVMADGNAHGVHRAVAFALSNLAAIAIMEHQYERALSLSEHAINVRRRIGDRMEEVQPITNLAELRLSLGMVDEAEQGLRFGLAACGQNLPLSRYAYFAKAAAQVHLERGDTGLATKELAMAVSGATCSGEKSVLEQCHRIAARIALEDGDVARATVSLGHAAKLRRHAFAEADFKVLSAKCARALGRSFMDEARDALAAAQEADDPNALREAHVLLHHAYRQVADDAAATSHLRSAIAQRQRVAEALPATLGQRYLTRRALAELNEIELGEIDAEPAVELSGLRSSLGSSLAGSLAGTSNTLVVARPSERRLVGDSAPLRTLRGIIKRIAATSTTVLISGETGTGKELVAEAIHRASDRSRGPLVKVNCAALVETLLLSELFGHEKGAFTGAQSRRRGRFEVADGGTLFLDEIGDISPRTQVALLRVLQEGTFERVGGCIELRANVRIVCATHRDLKAMVVRGELRQDLYYRLCGVVLEVPSLRERVSDIPALATALLERASTMTGIVPKPLSEAATRVLTEHAWPGNVRELENALRVATLFAKGTSIEVSDFTDNVEGLRYLAAGLASPLARTPGGAAGDECSRERPTIPPAGSGAFVGGGGVPESTPSGGDGSATLPPPSGSSDIVYAEVRGGVGLADMKRRLEQECIARALVESGGNITRAAALLGMKRPRLSQLVKQYDLVGVLEDMKS